MFNEALRKGLKVVAVKQTRGGGGDAVSWGNNVCELVVSVWNVLEGFALV